MPALIHLPLLRNPDKSKLSKRKNPTGILFYQAMGYLPEALMNFLGLLANSAGEDQDEMMSLSQMVERFSLEHLPLGGPVFDVKKLDWINGRYLREKLSVEEFADRVRDWAFPAAGRAGRIAELSQTRIERLSDLGLLLAFLFAGRLPLTADELREGKLDETSLRQAYQLALWELDALRTFDVAGIEATLKRVAEAIGKKFRDVARPFYVAVTGSPTSIPLYDSMELLGRDVVRERLRNALELLGAPSKKEADEWKKLLAPPEALAE
jgi:glutamyl-tRNA synthetase